MRELFIYYRVRGEQASRARAEVAHFQAALRARQPELTARLLHRAEHRDGLETWMETYACNGPDGVTPEMEAQIEQAAAGLQGLIEGSRHTEAFTT